MERKIIKRNIIEGMNREEKNRTRKMKRTKI